MNIEPNAGLALAFALMIAAPLVGHGLKDYWHQRADVALIERDHGEALTHEDCGVACLAVGYFVAGMMAMALLVSPFVGCV